MRNWNWSTFAVAHDWMVTFRLLGFGVMAYSTTSTAYEVIDRRVWGVPILPNWKLAFIAPWV